VEEGRVRGTQRWVCLYWRIEEIDTSWRDWVGEGVEVEVERAWWGKGGAPLLKALFVVVVVVVVVLVVVVVVFVFVFVFVLFIPLMDG